MNKHYSYGAVLKLTREDTPETIEDNFRKMKECGMNTAVIWPATFWWEPKVEGYPFNTGKLVLELAERHGIDIIMELAGQLTVMEYIPDFLMKPEFHPTTPQGHKLVGRGAFAFLNYFHPEVKELIKDNFRQAALAYRDYPALVGYDVFNETMFDSYDEYTLGDFREWLREKYGTIDNLNRVWERSFASFSEIGYETWKWMSIMPEADFCIWRKEAIPRFIKPWCDAILEVDDKHALIVDNIHSQVAPTAPYNRPQGDYQIKSVADIIGMSFYPKQQNGCMDNIQRWEVLDGYASAARREGFFISEMQTHIQALFNPGTCVLPHELKHWCYEAYAAGAKGLIYWMWRPFTKGLQTLGRGIVNYRGLPTERFPLAKEISETLYKYGPLKPVTSKVGVLYHELSDDYSRRYTDSYAVDKNFYNKSVYGAYKALADLNVRADIMTLDEIKNYKCVVLTNTCVLSRAEAELIKDYVSCGGTIIADGKVAVVDEESMLYDIIPGAGLDELFGEIYFETDNRETSFKLKDGTAVDVYYGRDRFDLTGAEVLGEFSDALPALVKNSYGKGAAYTFNINFFYGWLERGFESSLALLDKLCDTLSLRQTAADKNLRVRVSENDEKYLIFAFNYTDSPISSDIVLTLDNKQATVHADVEANGIEIIEIAK